MRRHGTWMLGVLLTMTAALDAQERGVGLPAVVRETQGVLTAAYPELRTQPVTWSIEATPARLDAAARAAVAPLPGATVSAPLVAATVTVDERGELTALVARGTLLDAARQKGAPLSRDAARDLEATGAKFAPGDVSVSDRLVPIGVKEQLRARTVRDASFRTDAPADAPDDARTWRVELETDDALRRSYTLVFEPIEGRLLSVVRR